MKTGSITKKMIEQALQLRREGLTWTEVGKRVALLAGRRSAFTEKGISRAVANHISGKVVRK